MKILLNKNFGTSGFGLIDLLLSSTVAGASLMAIMWCHVVGLKLHEPINQKLGTAAHERKVLGYLVGDLDAAQTLLIGTYKNGVFTQIPVGAPQSGNAVQLYQSWLNTNSYVRYYVDLQDRKLKRFVSTNQNVLVLSEYIQNTNNFRAESSSGTILTNEQRSFLVNVDLSFSQSPVTGVSLGNGLYAPHSLSTKMAYQRAF